METWLEEMAPICQPEQIVWDSGQFLLELRTPSEGRPIEKYGASMASFGTVLAVGAVSKTINGENNRGVVFLYDCDPGSHTSGQLIKTIHNPAGEFDGFASDNSIINDNGDIVVATYASNQTMGGQTVSSTGVVYRFKGPGK